ncbi:hypothetical protein M409DRAFT_17980 [Zasmidium cellare ATCC 36951]|uniref:Zn(2)-C6 fungal-type domain-containing protein n=1 Tax=Zasmidium cellare ATCC 36951 TaxID=1080233 RepID=A0A6A6CXI3_ZASCE|nr:uncharacterized protein M409DRAFT_17980 [Zasmidium cellare ATCC 36951]KAF2171745.1 hypothetical protein M409DRAFT_17980 [Zasmidium cellare ATCC 36951]
MVRKTHTKSRKGCLQCKKRHVKCDETRPRCRACSRLELDCTWAPGPNAPSPSPSTPSTLQTGGSNNGASSSASAQLDIPDLRLLHFWTTNTANTVQVPAHGDIWQVKMVEMGFRHPFVLHGILAVAAIHRAGIYPAESEELTMQSSSHMDVAISGLRYQIEHPDPAAATAVFALSGVLVIHSLGMAQIHPPSDPIGDLCHWFRLVKGTQACVAGNWIRLLSSELAPILTSVDRKKDPGRGVAEVLQIQDLIRQEVPEDDDLHEAYLQAVDELHTVFVNVHHYIRQQEISAVNHTLSWVATVRPAFLDLLYNRDQLALVILAHFAVLFRLQENSWWMRGWARWTLDAVQAQLEPRYHEWTAWACRQCEEG